MRRTRAAVLETRVGEAMDNVGPWWYMALADRLDEEAKFREAGGALGILRVAFWETVVLGTRAAARSEDEAKDDEESMVVDEQEVLPGQASLRARVSQAAKSASDWLSDITVAISGKHAEGIMTRAHAHRPAQPARCPTQRARMARRR